MMVKLKKIIVILLNYFKVSIRAETEFDKMVVILPPEEQLTSEELEKLKAKWFTQYHGNPGAKVEILPPGTIFTKLGDSDETVNKI